LAAGRRATMIDKVIEVTMKSTADQVVAFESAVAAPRGPKAVWLPMPPKAAAMSPLLPLCSRTTMIRNRQTMMWTMVMSVMTIFVFELRAACAPAFLVSAKEKFFWCGKGDLHSPTNTFNDLQRTGTLCLAATTV